MRIGALCLQEVWKQPLKYHYHRQIMKVAHVSCALQSKSYEDIQYLCVLFLWLSGRALH